MESSSARERALPRLRQMVLAARDLPAACASLESAIGVADPFRDEGVGHFGLHNAVYALGDTFVEIVSPVQEGTAAGRQLDRHGGDCGYMAMFEVADEAATRTRLADAGVRIVWDTRHDDIVDLHLHPKDVPGAIVALDITDPVGSWRWGGPDWTARIPSYGAGGLLGITVAVDAPDIVARRWAGVLGLPEPNGTKLTVGGGDQEIAFVATEDGQAEGIVGVHALSANDGRGPVRVCNVTFDRSP